MASKRVKKEGLARVSLREWEKSVKKGCLQWSGSRALAVLAGYSWLGPPSCWLPHTCGNRSGQPTPTSLKRLGLDQNSYKKATSHFAVGYRNLELYGVSKPLFIQHRRLALRNTVETCHLDGNQRILLTPFGATWRNWSCLTEFCGRKAAWRSTPPHGNEFQGTSSTTALYALMAHIPTRIQCLLHALKEAFGQGDQDLATQSLDHFFSCHRGKQTLAEYSVEFDAMLDEAADRAGLQLATERCRSLLPYFKNSGLSAKQIDHI